MSNCTQGYTNQAEFVQLNNCDIPVAADVGLRSASIIIVGIICILEIVIAILRYEEFKKKNGMSKVLLMWAFLENFIMPLRSILGITLKYRSQNNIYIALLTHLSAASVAGLAIMFVYFEIVILHNSSLSRKESWWYKHRKIILGCVSTLMLIGFIGGPILVYFGIVTPNQAFWTPVILIDFTVIPYLCISGITVYKKIQSMQKDDFKELSRQILIMVISCSFLGLFTGTVGIVAWRGQFNIEWILIELCWISAILFSGFIYFIMSRTRKSKSMNVSKSTGLSTKESKNINTGSSDVSTISMNDHRLATDVGTNDV